MKKFQDEFRKGDKVVLMLDVDEICETCKVQNPPPEDILIDMGRWHRLCANVVQLTGAYRGYWRIGYQSPGKMVPEAKVKLRQGALQIGPAS